jgi:hypothetical protein
MAFVHADTVLLFALFTYRYLRSGQLARLTGRSVQVVRRRMRELLKLGYAVSLERQPMSELVYALGAKGWEHVAKELDTSPAKLPYSAINAKSAETIFLQHTLLTNDIRISFDLALRDHAHVSSRRAVPEWEIANPEARKAAERFALAEDMKHKINGKKRTIRFRPDALFLLYPKAQGPQYSAALFLESDRSTESVAGKIREKYFSYMLYFQLCRYWEVWKAGKMRCLFVIEGGNPNKRITKMRDELQTIAAELGDPNPVEGESKAAFVYIFRFCDASLLSEQSVIDQPIWTDWRGKPIALFKPTNPVASKAEDDNV